MVISLQQRIAAAKAIVDELTYRSYREQRRLSPHIAPERWDALYPFTGWKALEARYQAEQHGSRCHECGGPVDEYGTALTTERG